MKLTKNLEVMLPDTRGVVISPWGRGNTKLGGEVITYSKEAVETCPGATEWCKEHCYARRIAGPVLDVYKANAGFVVPDLPTFEPRFDWEAHWNPIVRIHVSGDFDSVAYINSWIALCKDNPNTIFWAYTRSWRVEGLLPSLEILRALPNVQLFASVDRDTDLPPKGWRIAFIKGDSRAKGIVCPEELGTKENCQTCKYCWKGKRGNVIFLPH